MQRVNYYIDKTNLADLGIVVSSSEGILGYPQKKDSLKTDFKNMHGVIRDTNNNYYKERNITLKAHILAYSKRTLADYIFQLEELIKSNGYHRLMIDIDTNLKLYFQVVCDSNLEVDKKWSQGNIQHAEISIKLVEPLPIKRVLSFVPTEENNTLELSFNGDKNNVFDVFVENYKHTELISNNGLFNYTYLFDTQYNNKEQIIIISGDIDNINEFETNGNIIYNKI